MSEKNKDTQSPSELTRKITRVNIFDATGLEANRAGRLSLNQFLVSLAAVGSFVFNIAGIYLLIRNFAVGTIYLRASDTPLKSIPMYAVVLLVIAIFWWKGAKGKSIGFDRYEIKNIYELPSKGLLVVDLILWRVAEYQGPVMRYTDDSVYYTGTNSPAPDQHTVSHCYYRTTWDKFPVSKEAFDTLPAGKTQEYRLYYLPLSKIMVNLEAV